MDMLSIRLSSSSLATAAFAIVTDAPRRSLICCSLPGAFGRVVYQIYAQMGGSITFGLLLGSLGVAFISNLFSKRPRMPVTIFSIPGVVPLVPGGLAYQAVRNLVTGSYQEAAHHAIQTIVIVGVVTSGLVLSETLNHNVRDFEVKRDAIMLRRKKRFSE